MKRLSIATLAVALLLGCGSEPGALLARIQLDSDLPATCVDFQVRDGTESVLVEKKLPRDSGTNELKVAVYRGSNLPAQVSLFARPMFGGGCEDPNLLPNGTPDEHGTTFPQSSVTEVKLLLHRPTSDQDKDGDGYAGTAAGGPDCADNDPSIHPGATDQCLSGVDMDCDGRAGCNDPDCAGQACVAPPAQLAFATDAQKVQAGRCSGMVTVQAEDASGKAQDVAGNTPVNLSASPSANFGFYSDPGCTSALTLVTIPEGHHTASFYFRGATAGTATLTAATSGISSVSQDETVQTGPTAALGITTPARTASAGACTAMMVQAQDAFSNPSPPTAATTLALGAAPSAGFTFYSDAGCTTSVGQLSLAAGQGSVTVYFIGLEAGAVQVTASAAGLNAASQAETIIGGMPATLTFTTAPRTVTAGSCSAVITVEAHDAWGNPATVPVATPVGLASQPAGATFFSDAACGTSIARATLPAGGSSASFYVKAGATGPLALTASAGLASATQTETIAPAPPTALAIATATQLRAAGACSGAVTVQSRDANGNPSPVAAATAVSLSASPSTGFTFYSNSTCSTAVTSVTIAAASSSASFYFAGTSPGTVTLTASASGLSSATQAETLTAGPPTSLVFATAAQNVAVNTCSGQATVQLKDAYGNPAPVSSDTAVNLAASPGSGFVFYSDATCSTAVAFAAIPSGGSSGSFYFKGSTATNVTVTASVSSPSLSVNQTETLH